ncbi:MAG: hypothetical protein ACRC9L_03575 [Brevinema sp.]
MNKPIKYAKDIIDNTLSFKIENVNALIANFHLQSELSSAVNNMLESNNINGRHGFLFEDVVKSYLEFIQEIVMSTKGIVDVPRSTELDSPDLVIQIKSALQTATEKYQLKSYKDGYKGEYAHELMESDGKVYSTGAGNYKADTTADLKVGAVNEYDDILGNLAVNLSNLALYSVCIQLGDLFYRLYLSKEKISVDEINYTQEGLSTVCRLASIIVFATLGATVIIPLIFYIKNYSVIHSDTDLSKKMLLVGKSVLDTLPTIGTFMVISLAMQALSISIFSVIISGGMIGVAGAHLKENPPEEIFAQIRQKLQDTPNLQLCLADFDTEKYKDMFQSTFQKGTTKVKDGIAKTREFFKSLKDKINDKSDC